MEDPAAAAAATAAAATAAATAAAAPDARRCAAPRAADCDGADPLPPAPRTQAILRNPNTARRGYRNAKPQRVHVDASIPAVRVQPSASLCHFLCRFLNPTLHS